MEEKEKDTKAEEQKPPSQDEKKHEQSSIWVKIKAAITNGSLKEVFDLVKAAAASIAGFAGAITHNLLSKLAGEKSVNYNPTYQSAQDLKKVQREKAASEKENNKKVKNNPEKDSKENPSLKNRQAMENAFAEEVKGAQNEKASKEKEAIDALKKEEVIKALESDSVNNLCDAIGCKLSYNKEKDAILVSSKNGEQAIAMNHFFRDREKMLYKAMKALDVSSDKSPRQLAIDATSIATVIDVKTKEEVFREVSIIESFGITTITCDAVEGGLQYTRNGKESDVVHYEALAKDYARVSQDINHEGTHQAFIFKDKDIKISAGVKAPDKLFLSGRDKSGKSVPIGNFKLNNESEDKIKEALAAYGVPANLSPKAIIDTVKIMSSPASETPKESGVYAKIHAKEIECRVKTSDGRDFEVARFKTAKDLDQRSIQSVAEKIEQAYSHNRTPEQTLNNATQELATTCELNELTRGFLEAAETIDITHMTHQDLAALSLLPDTSNSIFEDLSPLTDELANQYISQNLEQIKENDRRFDDEYER